MCLKSLFGGGGDNGAAEAAAAARAAEEARQARIRQGTDQINQTFSSFDDGYFGDISNSYTGYYLPQLERQYVDARKALVLRLGQQGTLNSSSGQKILQDMDRGAALQRGLIGDRAVSSAAQARGNVEDARSQLLAQLSASADPAAAATAAAARAKSLSAPPAFDPLENLFTNFAQIGANNIMANASTGKTSPILFQGGGGGNSAKVVK